MYICIELLLCIFVLSCYYAYCELNVFKDSILANILES